MELSVDGETVVISLSKSAELALKTSFSGNVSVVQDAMIKRKQRV
jgi:hypothetical protein